MTRVRMLAASARPLSEVLVDAQRASLAMRLQKNARTDPSDAASRNGVPILTCTGHLVPPLRWWRQLPAPAFTAVHVAVLRRAIAGIFIIGEPDWPAAAKGDPAAAIGVALRDIKRRRRPNPGFNLVMSALLSCAIEGSPTAALVLECALGRMAAKDPACAAIAASWQAFTLGRREPEIRSRLGR